MHFEKHWLVGKLHNKIQISTNFKVLLCCRFHIASESAYLIDSPLNVN